MDITIPTFVNNHLFWIIDKKKSSEIKHIESRLSAVYKHTVTPSRKHFEVKETAAVLIDDIFCRIVVQRVDIGKSNGKRRYIGWLLDYGKMIETDSLFVLPEEIKEFEAVAQQASLNNVCYILQKLDLGVTGEMRHLPTEVSTLAAYCQSSLLINNANSLLFQVETEINKVLVGDILLVNKDGIAESLTKALMDRVLLCNNERIFKRIINNLEIFKSTHVEPILRICKNAGAPVPKKDDAKKIIKHRYGIDLDTLGEEIIGPNTAELSGPRRKHLLNISNSDSEVNSSKDKSLSFNKDDTDSSQESGAEKSIDSSVEKIVDTSENASFEIEQNINSQLTTLDKVEEEQNIKRSSRSSSLSKRALALQKMSKKFLRLSDTSDNESENASFGNEENINSQLTTLEKVEEEQDMKRSSSSSSLSKRALALQKMSKKFLRLSDTSDNESVRVEKNIGESNSVVSSRQRLVEYMKRKKSQTDESGKTAEGLDHSFETASSVGDSDAQLDSSAEYTSVVDKHTSEAPVRTEGEEETTPPKRKFPRNTLFMPAGGNFSNLSQKKNTVPSNAKRRHVKETYPSDSDCPTVRIDRTQIEKNEEKSESKTSGETENDDDVEEKVKDCTMSNTAIRALTCKCKTCRFWAESDDWDQNLKFEEPESIKEPLTPIIRPPLLLKTGEKEKEIEGFPVDIMSLDFSRLTKVQKMGAAKLLVHGESVPPPIEKVAELNIHKDIHQNIHKMKYIKAKRIQVYAWPAMTRNQHVVMVGDAGTGKTMAYLPILCSFVHERQERYSQLFKMGGGPIVVILCNTSDKCEEVYDTTKLISNGLQYKIYLMTYPNEHVNTKHIDILITMPTVLKSLLQSRAVNLKRLCHFVLEDGDAITKNHSELLNQFFKVIQQVLKTRVCAKSVQLIMCSEHWTSHIESICKKLDKLPFICIGNYLEAALYGKMQLTMKMLNTACKEQEVKNLLFDTFNYTKTIIICDNEEIEDLQTMLMLKGIDYTPIPDHEEKETMLYLEETWNRTQSGNHTVLICSDFVFESMLSVTSASLLIHYSMPKTWSVFHRRFSCLLENCSSPLSSKEKKGPVKSVVFIDEHCENVMSRFYNFLNVAGLMQQLPQIMKVYFKDLQHKAELEKVKKNVPLCQNLKVLGYCTTFECEHRHVLDKNTDIETPDLPKNGKIKFRICHMDDVTTYTIKMLEHYGLDNKLVKKFDDKTLKINDGLLTISRKILREPLSHPIVGHLYSYLDDKTKYLYRCRILSKSDSMMKIKLIDMGTTITCVKSSLFRLPKEFKEIPEQTHQVYLANLVPPHQDQNFSAKSFKLLQFHYNKLSISEMTMTGQIHLQLGQNLWLKYVEEERVMYDQTLPKCGFQLHRELTDKMYAVKDGRHLKNLYDLCKNADIELPVYEMVKTKVVREPAQVKPLWAFLDMETVNEVVFTSAMSPDEVYVRLEKFSKQLEDLHKSIIEAVKKPFYPEAGTISVGKCYLAKDPEGGEYGRAIVRQIEGEQALCFFVDHGDEAIIDISEIKHIDDQFISRLPFQTIQCSLHGVRPVNGDGSWSKESVDLLYEYSLIPGTDEFRQLFVKPCKKEANRLIESQKRYSVLLKDGFETRRIINQLIIDCGYGLGCNEELIEDFEIPETKEEEYDEEKEEDEEEEEEIDIENQEIEENEIKFYEEILAMFFGPPSTENRQSTPNKPQENKASSSRDLPQIKAAPPVNYYTPDVLWSQTDDVVKLTIKLPGVGKYSTKVTKNRMFMFSTVKDNKNYELKFFLFEAVANTFQHTYIGHQVRVTLTKIKKACEWPQLLLSNEKARNIRYDLDAIRFDEEKKRKFLQLPVEDNDGDDSDPEDRMIVVSSDLDSEYDEDIPNCEY